MVDKRRIKILIYIVRKLFIVYIILATALSAFQDEELAVNDDDTGWDNDWYKLILRAKTIWGRSSTSTVLYFGLFYFS